MLRRSFVEASPTVKKAVSCYKAGRLVASLPSFHRIQLSLAVCKFCAAGKKRWNEATDGCVRTFDAWCRGVQSAPEQLQLCELSGPTFRFTTQEFSMVGGYTENLEKPQNGQNWRVGACSRQYGKYNMNAGVPKKELCVVCYACIKLQFPFPLPLTKNCMYIVHTEIERLQPVSNNGTLSEMNIFMYYKQHKLPGLLMLVVLNRSVVCYCLSIVICFECIKSL